MVATVRCEEIASEKYTSFTSNEVFVHNWHSLEEAVKSGPVAGFGKKLNSILYTSLSEYDAEATYFDEGVRSAKRKHLEEKLLQLVQPAYQSMLGHLRIETLEKFKEAFDKALKGDEGFSVAACKCIKTYMASFDAGYADAAVKLANWDSSKIRDKLRRDINDHIASVRAAKLSELTSSYEAKLNEALSGPVEALLDGVNKETWPLIRKLLQRETESILSGLSTALSGFDMDEQTQKKTLTSLENHARGVVEGKAKEEAGRVLIRMKDRFSTLFNHDSESMPRVWTGKEDIRSITKTAHSAALKLLSVMAAIRLDDNVDNIENTLCSALLDTKGIASVTKWGSTTSDPLASSTWDKEANKRSNNWLPPPWAIVALIILGFNEFLTLLRCTFHNNPLYVGIIFVGYLMLKALWVQLDISGEFSHGVLPGIISLSTKFIPTIMSLLKKLAEEGQAAANNNPQSTNGSASKSLPNSTSPLLTASSTVTSSANVNCWNIVGIQHLTTGIVETIFRLFARHRALMILWTLWFYRNIFVWQHKDNTLARIIEFAKIYTPSNDASIIGASQWARPTDGLLDCNVDAYNASTFAAIVRDSNGQFLKGMTSYNRALMELHIPKIWSIREALS
ncbi:hypothetical protein GOBAR_AA39958 [Gossypium barbadense]|uniref:Sey1/RHD3-like three-helix bundle domain-containing protein n=1 Tax=Gossypium barbadense TaxID=3634 RepID=A0A2P5VPH5_GOSBA|nr:hypothetical protein GOBAR_AA39958 [Gossypium barbadense]